MRHSLPWPIFVGVAILALVGLLPGTLCAQEPTKPAADAKAAPAAKKPANSLDDELLKELGGEPAKPKAASEKSKAVSGKPGASDLDDELLKGLGETKPTAGKEDSDPVSRLTRQMRQVQELMQQAKRDAQTRQLQDQIVKNLEDLIKQEQQRQQQQQQQQQSSSSSSSQERQKIEQAQSQPSQQESNKPARDSSDKLQNRQAEKVDMAKMRDTIKDVWGQLPGRLREQMLQSGIEQFLPKYELLIEEYFKALAEQPSREDR